MDERKTIGDLLLLIVFVVTLTFIAVFSGSTILQSTSLVIAIVIVLFRPAVGLVLAIVLYSTQLIQYLAGIPGLIYRATPFVILLVTAAGLLIRAKPNRQSHRANLVAWPVLLIAAVTALANFATGDLFGILIAGSMYAVPFLGFYIGSRLNDSEVKILKLFLFLSLLANFIAATWQSISGVDAFLSLGLKYGTSVRTIDGVLRAPGLTIINSELGLFAGAIGLFAALQLILRWRLQHKFWAISTTLISIGCILMSTSRSGALVIATGIIIALVYVNNQMARKAATIWSASFFLLLIVLGFGYIGATSNASWADRLAQWFSLLSSGVQVFGSGFGAVGAATFSGYSSRNPVFTDNVYISILIQFGLAGLLLFCIWIYRLLRARFPQDNTENIKALVITKSILVSLLVTGILVEVIDYPLAMLCASLFIGGAKNDFTDLESKALKGREIRA